MQRQHPHGVRGVEPSEAADSIVYQALRDTRNAKEAYQRAHAEARLEFLKARRATPAEHPMRTHDATGPGPSLFQRKGRVAGRNSSVRSDTHYSFRPSSTATASTAYRSNQVIRRHRTVRPCAPVLPCLLHPHSVIWNQERLVDERAAQPARTQQLLDADAGGRRYNIISGIATTTATTVVATTKSRHHHHHPPAWQARAVLLSRRCVPADRRLTTGARTRAIWLCRRARARRHRWSARRPRRIKSRGSHSAPPRASHARTCSEARAHAPSAGRRRALTPVTRRGRHAACATARVSAQ